MLAAVAAVVAAAVAGAVLLRDVRLAAAGGAGQTALDSTAATVGLALAYLLYGRFRLQGRVRDLLLCLAVLLLGGSNALLAVLPVVLGEPGGRLTNAGIVLGLVAGGLFAAAACAPPLEVPPERKRTTLALVLAPAGLLLAAGWFLNRTAPRQGLGAADTFGGTQDGLVTFAQLLAALAFVVAAVGWSRTAGPGDRVAGPLAAAAVFGAGSRINFAVAESPTATWVTAGTLLRVLFYVALIGAAVVEVRTYWSRVAEAAVLEERRRLARELHDGLAQELAFIVTQARGLREQTTNRRAQLIVGASERALDESRRAIAALTRPLDEPFEVSLGQTVEEVARRFGARVHRRLAPGVGVTGARREALLRIAREAVANAARHGRAGSVIVSLDEREGVRLRVEDDGDGFDVAGVDPRSGQLGLTSMRERAEALGGSFEVVSQPGATTVEVRLP